MHVYQPLDFKGLNMENSTLKKRNYTDGLSE